MNLFLFHVLALSFLLSGAVLHTAQNLREFYNAFAHAYGTQFDYTKAPCFNKDIASDFIDLFSELAGRSVFSKNVSSAFRNIIQRDSNETVGFINSTLACMIEHQETVMMFGSFDDYLISKTFWPEEFLEFLDVFPEDTYLLMSLMEYYTSKQEFNRSALTLALLLQQTKQYQKGFIKYRKDLTKEDAVNASSVEYTNFLKGICKSTFMSCFYDSKLCWEFEDTTCAAEFLKKLTEIPASPKEDLTKNAIKFISDNYANFKSCVDSDTWSCEHKTGDYMTFKWRFHGTFWNAFEHLDKFVEAKPEEFAFYLKIMQRLFIRHNFEALGLVVGPVLDHASKYTAKDDGMGAMPMDEKLLKMGYNDEL